jgi:hypothetical protein
MKKNEESYNSADEKKVKNAKEKVRIERQQELEDIKTLLKMPAGVRFFRRLMEHGKVFCTTFTGNSVTFFQEGHRNLALIFFNDICEATPNKVAELMVKKVEEAEVVEEENENDN